MDTAAPRKAPVHLRIHPETFAFFREATDRRCDLEAGLAKLSGTAVAWAVADNALQIHGGNGYATKYQISRVLCDARILNIFEGRPRSRRR